jgi:hypothetical protein
MSDPNMPSDDVQFQVNLTKLGHWGRKPSCRYASVQNRSQGDALGQAEAEAGRMTLRDSFDIALPIVSQFTVAWRDTRYSSGADFRGPVIDAAGTRVSSPTA